MKAPTKTETQWAYRAITEQLDLIEEIRRHEGNREANACAMFGDTQRRMGTAVQTLRSAGKALPMSLNPSSARLWGWTT